MMDFAIDEALITEVVFPKDEERHELQIRKNDDVLTFYLDNEKVFAGDWSGNFLQVFQRALELWNEKPKGEKE